jgi:hypothetical protein
MAPLDLQPNCEKGGSAVLKVGKTNEKRAEQRLRYRWPVRFAVRAGQRPCSGQAVDITSQGMAFLYHPSENCPRSDQLITANFGVPHFNAHGSFDTVLFNRVGRVCRVDSLSEKVSRVAVQFDEPLFFKPGEQNIGESDAQQRLEAVARSVLEIRLKGRKHDEDLVKGYAEALEETAGLGAASVSDRRAEDPNVQKKGEKGARQAEGRRLLKKVDSFITDKSKVF